MSWELLAEQMQAFAEQLHLESATESTGQKLMAIQGALDNTWRTQRTMKSDLPIPVPPPRAKGLHPVKCELYEADLKFSFRLGPNFGTERLPALAEFQVCVRGLADYGHCVVELEDHWRVDTHAFQGNPREPHPLFHYQRGGYAQDGWTGQSNYVPGPDLPAFNGDVWRALLQSPGPRIPIPPLCPILAIDFVIGQHDGGVWSRLRGTPEYRTIITKAQTRLWIPLFEGLSDDTVRRKWLGSILI